MPAGRERSAPPRMEADGRGSPAAAPGLTCRSAMAPHRKEGVRAGGWDSAASGPPTRGRGRSTPRRYHRGRRGRRPLAAGAALVAAGGSGGRDPAGGPGCGDPRDTGPAGTTGGARHPARGPGAAASLSEGTDQAKARIGAGGGLRRGRPRKGPLLFPSAAWRRQDGQKTLRRNSDICSSTGTKHTGVRALGLPRSWTRSPGTETRGGIDANAGRSG